MQTRLQSGQDLLVDGEIRFAEILAALGVADDDVFDAQVCAFFAFAIAAFAAAKSKM